MAIVAETLPVIEQTFEERIGDRLNRIPSEKLASGAEFKTFDMDAHLDALNSGQAIVSPEYSSELERLKTHEVFPDKTVERRRSAHGVSFGRLVGYKPSKKRDGNLMSVAFKLFEKPKKALQEFYGYKILQEIDTETFDPIGIVPSEDGNSFVVITKKRDDFQSLDRDEWIVGRQPHDAREVEIGQRNNRTVAEISSTLANLHSNGVFHPDGQIKNFAVSVNGTVGVIDTENLTVRNTDDLDNPALAWEDLEKLARSLILEHDTEENSQGEDKIFGVGMLAHMGLPQIRNAFWELVFEPYLAVLEDKIRHGGDSDYLTTLAYTIQEYFENDSNWPLDLVSNTLG